VVIVRSSPHKAGTHDTPWFDRLSEDRQTFIYFGDNKAESTSVAAGTWARPRPGNVTLLELAREHGVTDRDTRIETAPIVVVRTVPLDGRTKGQIEVVGLGIVTDWQQVSETDPDGRSFENFRFDISMLELDDGSFDWSWITARRSDELSAHQVLERAPAAWRRWVNQT
jgi:hypothetical protein